MSEPEMVEELAEALLRLAGLAADNRNCWCRSWEHRDEHTRACENARRVWADYAAASKREVAR